MEDRSSKFRPPYPLMRIYAFGEFVIERLIPPFPRSAETPYYMRLTRREWRSRGPALLLLKVLLCCSHRRASKEDLMKAIWPDGSHINASHALDTAVSVLRRHILSPYPEESLLQTSRSGNETRFSLPGQHLLWLDADAFLSQANRAIRAEAQGKNPLPLLEEVYTRSSGDFLEDEQGYRWAQRRRNTINAARRRVLYKMVDLYVRSQQVDQAEELLFAYLEEAPTDEDALCHLMFLLAQGERRQEALDIYQYTVDLLQEEQHEPALYTQKVAQSIQNGCTIRGISHDLMIHEDKGDYTTACTTWAIRAPFARLVA